MENYLKQNNLPNEWDYFDPAKADDKRECGLHAAWGGKASKRRDRSLGSRIWGLEKNDFRPKTPNPKLYFMGEPFENSAAWKAARELTNEVYSLCHRNPLAKDFGLRDQLQRAAVSVMNNVAEGWESLHVAEKTPSV